MEKGTFAKYKNKIYRVSRIDEDILRLVSKDQEDLKHGFKEKTYPSYYKDTADLPKLFVYEIKKEEADEIYQVDYKAKFNGNVFNLSFDKTATQLRLGTSNAELAKENGFDRTDKYYYEKEVNQDEIDIRSYRKY
ncbi:hypothetical protein FZC84_01285 [Rossellomorea vietnamensis]|uniref:Uncharacterized protein n=1 Tax=Rossellomorea vietnamensis TaxID=218284 RepID=A0A5D4MI35_9BACI|nr:hypothetical protein [Rossellomorea vietnamensis]TYS01322.1 hypothetical protein FZC84_01285 [Rossellomorea vietnamensis]